MKVIRVMIVEDSATIRQLLIHLINADPRLDVVASAGSAEEALNILTQVRPDVITMDIRLPGMNGFEATALIMARQPTPVVVVSASVQAEDLNITMNALHAGALSVIEKPVGLDHADYSALSKKLRDQLVSMSQVRVVRQRVWRPMTFPRSKGQPMVPPPLERAASFESSVKVIALVASTGGPAALVQVLAGLPADFAVPILVVQHMAPSFIDGFISWLDRSVPLKVVPARNGTVPQRGHVYVAPSEFHMEMGPLTLRLSHAPPMHNQRPSGSVLFSSLARALGPEAIGVLLTGMGEDGADGLLEMKQAGAYTISEDQSTAVVFGMPAAAIALGAATVILPLPAVAARLHALVGAEEPK